MGVGTANRAPGRMAAAAMLGTGLLLSTHGVASASLPVVFKLSGTFGDNVQVVYFGADDELEPSVEGLPWSTSFDYNGSKSSLVFSGVHPGSDPGSVTCTVSVGGRVMVSHTNNAPPTSGVGAVCHLVDLGKGYVGD